MGNAGLDGLCVSRDSPAFIPPNTEYVTYQYNSERDKEVKFWQGLTGSEKYTPEGFLVKSQTSEKHTPKVYTVKEYSPNASQQRVYVSGRVLVQCGSKASSSASQGPICAFAVCTRGRPIYQSLKLRFTHTAQVRSSGVVFALYLVSAPTGVFLCPRIMLVLENGDEVLLVDDRLGPVRTPQAFYTDFAIVDDGGRNVQLDLIFRGTGDADGKGMRTLRTCLQDYTSFNNQIQPANISLGYSNIATYLPNSVVHLQNFVVSEHAFDTPVPEPQPYDVWKEAAHAPEKESSSKIIFEGEDARTASMALDVPEAPVVHPQMALSVRASANSAKSKADKEGGPLQRWVSRGAPPGSDLLAESSVDEFWYHIRYDGESAAERADPAGDPYLRSTHIRGEFWLSKQAVEKKNVYFHCSSTLSQALSMCIAFRFSCPTDYLSLIADRASKVLRHTHIPTNGVVMGIEQDPRHDSLIRMFIEHRNEILEDMVICECRPEDLARTIVHQEIYDGGSTIIYRLTLLHRDGARQSAVLQVAAEHFDDPHFLDSARSGGQYQLVEDPSPRWPISPCLVRHDLSPANRIFVYSNVSHDEFAPDAAGGDTDGEGTVGAEDFHSAGGDLSTQGTPGPVFRSGDNTSDGCSAEDYQSAGGGFSDAEDSNLAGGLASNPASKGGRSAGAERGVDNEFAVEAVWRRPLIESAVLLSRMEDSPFKCFPASMP